MTSDSPYETFAVEGDELSFTEIPQPATPPLFKAVKKGWAADSSEAEEEGPIKVDLSHTCYVNADMMKTIKPIRYLVGTILARGYLTVFAGGGGIGKSTAVSSIAMQAAGVSVGLPYLPHATDPKAEGGVFRVVYINTEDGIDHVKRQFAALALRFGMPKIDIAAFGKDTLRLTMQGRHGLVIIDPATGVVTQNERAVVALGELVRDLGCDILIVDPLKDVSGGVPMRNEVITVLMEAFADMAVDLDIAVGIVAHTRKPSGTARGKQDQHDIKFGSEIVDTARVVLNCNGVDDETKERWGVNTRRNVVEMGITKTNIGPKRTDYYEVELVKVVTQEDGLVVDIPVAVPFKPPSTAAKPNTLAKVWPHIRAVLASEAFVKSAPNASASEGTTTLTAVIEAALKAEKLPMKQAAGLRKEMEAAGWIDSISTKVPGTKDKVGRAVLGPNAPE